MTKRPLDYCLVILDIIRNPCLNGFLIKSYRHRGLKELFERGRTARIDKQFHQRLVERLDVLNRAPNLNALALPGWNLHPLKGHNPTRYAIAVNGPWRITFEFDKGDMFRLDFEQYH